MVWWWFQNKTWERADNLWIYKMLSYPDKKRDARKDGLADNKKNVGRKPRLFILYFKCDDKHTAAGFCMAERVALVYRAMFWRDKNRVRYGSLWSSEVYGLASPYISLYVWLSVVEIMVYFFLWHLKIRLGKKKLYSLLYRKSEFL